jgi:Pyruvate/2-oxoacid:ferredoxin oxidoreductase delta subunit
VRGAVPADTRGALERIEGWISSGELEVPRCAIVHGGGNTAIDLARILRHRGAEVHVVCASAGPDEDAPASDRMAALPREVAMAVEEGVVIHGHATLGQLLLRGGRVRGVGLVRLRKLPGADGRTRRVAFEGTETVLEADMVVQATGEQVEPQGLETLLRGAAFLPADFHGRLPEHPGVFAAGDACGDGGTVAAAIGRGHRAALAIDRHLRGLADPDDAPREPIPYERLHLRYFDRQPRQEPALRALEERDLEHEEEAGLGRARAAAEAGRCFSCGGCLACDNCWTLCPDMAVLKTPEPMADGSPYVFDLEHCKGCGLCAHECPPGFIEMEPDRR